MPNYQSGGAFLPNEPVNFTKEVNFVTAPTSGTDAGTTFVTSTGTQTLTNKTLTTPTVLFTAATVTATGATGSAAAALSAVTPALYTVTGASGAGVALPTGAAVAGAYYVLVNKMTGAFNVYAVGGTINGVTGTTAFPVTATGNLTANVLCVSAGAWSITGNT